LRLSFEATQISAPIGSDPAAGSSQSSTRTVSSATVQKRL